MFLLRKSLFSANTLVADYFLCINVIVLLLGTSKPVKSCLGALLALFKPSHLNKGVIRICRH